MSIQRFSASDSTEIWSHLNRLATDAETMIGEVDARLIGGAWTNILRGNSGYTSSVQFLIRAGIVFFRGSVNINVGTWATSWIQALLTLPTEARPSTQIYAPLSRDGLVVGRCGISSSGIISLAALSAGGTDRLDMSTVSYPTTG